MKRILLLTFSLISINLLAQNPCACCDEAHQRFDFWVGDWLVKDTSGNQVGENTITKTEADCILLEKWRGSSGGTGTSSNYYDRTDSTWNQLWIDNNGGVLKLKGNLEGNSMVLKGDIQQGQNGEYYNLIKWTPNEDGTVTQLWQIFSKEGKVLQVLFKGIYHRKEVE